MIQSVRQMERADLLLYIKELEDHIKHPVCAICGLEEWDHHHGDERHVYKAPEASDE